MSFESLFFAWIRAGIRVEPRFESGVSILEYGRRPRLAFTALTLFFVAAAVLAPLRFPIEHRYEARRLLFSIAAIIAFLTTALFYTRITFDSAGVTVRRLLRRARTIPWSDFERVHFSDRYRKCRVTTWSSGRVDISYWMDGRAGFVSELKRRGVRTE